MFVYVNCNLYWNNLLARSVQGFWVVMCQLLCGPLGLLFMASNLCKAPPTSHKCIMKHQIRPHVNEHSLCHQCLGWHDDVIKWKHFLRYWPFMWGIHWSPVNFTHKGQWHEVLMFSLISAWINGWVNNHEAGDLRCHCAHHNIIVMNRDEFKNMYTVHSHWAATCYHWAVPFQVGTECIQQLSKSVKFSTHIWNW